MNINFKHIIAIDIETYSSTDIKKCGLYKYASAKDFKILILAYKIDNTPVQLLDLTNSVLCESFCRTLQNPTYLKTAFNAAFERICLNAHFNLTLNPGQWECTMVKAYQCGISGGLDQVS